jgi:hypothetical protein
MIGALLLAVLAIGACGGDDADPGETVQAYIDAYNIRDIDAVMAVFADDAVITNHPFASRIEGAEAIRSLQVDDFQAAGSDNAYEISDLEVSGDTVTWNHVWLDRCTGTGNEAVVENGKIVSWEFASVSC